MGRGRGKNFPPKRNDGGYVTRGQIADEKKRKAEEEKEERKQKRRSELFAPRKIIGPNDVLVDRRYGKIKIEEDVTVKQEVNEMPIAGCDTSAPTSGGIPPKDVDRKLVGEQDKDHGSNFHEVEGSHLDARQEGEVTTIQEENCEYHAPVDNEDMKIDIEHHVTVEVIEDDDNRIKKTKENLDTPPTNSSQNNELNLLAHSQQVYQLATKIQEENETLCRQGDEQRKILDEQCQTLNHMRHELQQLQEKMAKYEAPTGSGGSLNVIVEEPFIDNMRRPLDQVSMVSLQSAENLADERFENAFGNIFIYLNLESALNCRKVCKKWKDVVDSFLENHSSRRPFSKEVHHAQLKRGKLSSLDQDKKLIELERKYVFSDAKSIEEFLKVFKTGEINPFLGRSVVFQIDEDSKHAKRFKNDAWSKMLEVENEKYYVDGGYMPLMTLNKKIWDKLEQFFILYWNLVLRLLSRFGKHIWYVKIAQYKLGLTPVRLYEIVQECLPQLTNLRNLVVAGEIESFLTLPPHLCQTSKTPAQTARKSTGGYVALPKRPRQTARKPTYVNRALTKRLEPNLEELSRQRLKELTEYMEDYPTLPKLEKLESLEFFISDGITRDIQDAILSKCVKNNDQLLRFATSVISAESVAKLPGKALKEITVIENHLNIYYHLERSLRGKHPGTFGDISKLKGTNLEKMCLKDKQLYVPSILLLLKNFPTVCCLQLEGNVRFRRNEDVTNRNEFVQSLILKHKVDSEIYLDSGTFPKWIDFYDGLMSFFPKLRFLHITEVLHYEWEDEDDKNESDEEEEEEEIDEQQEEEEKCNNKDDEKKNDYEEEADDEPNNPFQCIFDQQTIQVNNSDIWTKFKSLEFIKLEVVSWDGERKQGKTWSRYYPL